MTKVELFNTVTRTFHKAGFQLKKHSPEILVVTGVVGTVVSAVMACKATLKVNAVLEEPKVDIDRIHEATEKGVTSAGVPYSVEDSKKDLTIVYAQTGLKLVKLYAPAIILGGLSLASILTSHNILHKRNVALAAAYATVDKGFKEYRGRVVERFGDALDRELKYNIKAKEIEETVVKEDGTEETVKKTVNVATVNTESDYARFFDETCTAWTKDPEDNLVFLKCQESYANDMLRKRGHLFLNEVYDMLGMQRSRAGQHVGWVYDTESGDGYVSFGIYDVHNEQKRLFVNGYERSILLDFNVDGDIYELMK